MQQLHLRLWIIAIFLLWPSLLFAKTPILKGDTDAYPRTEDEFASALVLDAASGKELYIYKPDTRWPAASLTKLLSALVTVERKPRWNKRMILTKRDEVGGGRLRVKPGATLTVRDLLYSSIVGSANNAAMALARSSGLGMKSFVVAMNQKAKKLGMNASRFVDPTGMSPANISTARDLAKIASAAFTHPALKDAVSRTNYRFRFVRPKIVKTIHTTNRLLTADSNLLIHGGKTGYLEEARHNLVVMVERQPRAADAPPLLIVVLGSPDAARLFASAKALAEWTWKGYEW